ncbi:SDR family oxidoreductase [Streptomyces spiralis]|uniref:SDR family oxidoreductase n=1 Tax=Streptomyces spiralis TaxID=66376 RepID=UPI0033CA6D4C
MRSILITGSSSGFGMHVAVALAERGWQVFASMRDTAKRDRLDRLAESSGVTDRIEVVQLDVASSESREKGVRQVLEACGDRLDAVLHNAGYTTLGFFEDLSPEQCRRLVETNLFGAMEVTRLVLPAMRARRRGRIALVTSNAVNVPHPLFSVYAATKWALEGWAEALAVELAPFGLDVVILQPGTHDTDFAGNVAPVLPEGSAYGELFNRAMPRLTRIGAYSRSTTKAEAEMCEVLQARRPRLRTRIGPDDKVAAWLARIAPYRVRERAVEWITGLKPARR